MQGWDVKLYTFGLHQRHCLYLGPDFQPPCLYWSIKEHWFRIAEKHASRQNMLAKFMLLVNFQIQPLLSHRVARQAKHVANIEI